LRQLIIRSSMSAACVGEFASIMCYHNLSAMRKSILVAHLPMDRGKFKARVKTQMHLDGRKSARTCPMQLEE
jgi:hypothetical protein